MIGIWGGGPQAIAAFENAEAIVIVVVSSTISPGENSPANRARRSSSNPAG